MKTAKSLKKQLFGVLKKDKSWFYFYVKNVEITNRNSYQREKKVFCH